MNLFDKLILAAAPSWGVKRLRSRAIATAISGAYEAGLPSRARKQRGDAASGDTAAAISSKSIRQVARDLDENNDVAHGILDTLVNTVIGENGIGIEPMVRGLDGALMTDFNTHLRELHKDWKAAPEVRKEHDWPAAERLIVRSLLRDGETFIQHIVGNAPKLNHGTVVPYSIEMIEADMVPIDYDEKGKNIKNGIRRNGWGEPTNFYIYKTHPGDSIAFMYGKADLKNVPATRMTHLKLTSRIAQGRGVSVFASVFTRLDDLRDFEESERMAARIAAAQVMAITKAPDVFSYVGDDDTAERSLPINPGSIWDNLAPGEDVKILSSDRPNNQMGPFRATQLRSVAGGTGATYSSISKDYDGSYSAQRQELVEGSVNTGVLRSKVVSSCHKPMWKNFVRAALLTKGVELPSDIDEKTLFDADFRGPALPWIDPLKERKADVEAVNNGLASRSQIIRSHGDNPDEVFRQIAEDNDRMKELGIEAQGSAPDQANQDTPDNNQDDSSNQKRKNNENQG